MRLTALRALFIIVTAPDLCNTTMTTFNIIQVAITPGLNTDTTVVRVGED